MGPPRSTRPNDGLAFAQRALTSRWRGKRGAVGGGSPARGEADGRKQGGGSYGSPILAAEVSADGNTAIVGGPVDNGTGAAWFYTRSNGVRTQQGSKLVGSGAAPKAE
jgi:hypothetical protein